jgi:DNA-binding response OmpR family regulator
VRTARNGEEAVAMFAERRPDLVLLDVMMPRMSGTAACAAIRGSDPLVPILFFTAMPSDVGAVRALGFGADDYIDKAKSPEELLARVASALRRSRAAGTGAGKSAPAPRLGMLRIGSVSVNFAEMTAKGPGVSARLTKSDAVILNLLARRRGEIVAHDDIIAALHDGDCAGELAAVRAAVARLKERLGRAGACITTERGFGYRLLA